MADNIKIIQSAEYIERVGSKSGKPYQAIEITLVNGYKKLVFFDFAETFIIKELLNRE